MEVVQPATRRRRRASVSGEPAGMIVARGGCRADEAVCSRGHGADHAAAAEAEAVSAGELSWLGCVQRLRTKRLKPVKEPNHRPHLTTPHTMIHAPVTTAHHHSTPSPPHPHTTHHSCTSHPSLSHQPRGLSTLLLRVHTRSSPPSTVSPRPSPSPPRRILPPSSHLLSRLLTPRPSRALRAPPPSSSSSSSCRVRVPLCGARAGCCCCARCCCCCCYQWCAGCDCTIRSQHRSHAMPTGVCVVGRHPERHEPHPGHRSLPLTSSPPRLSLPLSPHARPCA